MGGPASADPPDLKAKSAKTQITSVRNLLLLLTFLVALNVLKHGYSMTPEKMEYAKRQHGRRSGRNHHTHSKDYYSEDLGPIPNLRNKNIFYNRVEKCGSRSFTHLAKRLQKKNNFTVVVELLYKTRLKGLDLLREKARLAEFVPPTLYQRHIHFVDLNDAPLLRPVLINVIREPIERHVSMYNYENYGDMVAKTPPSHLGRRDINACVEAADIECHWTSSNLFNMGMYFCGMDDICRNSSFSKERVALAKKHIDEYAFIGTLEEFETSLIILEKMMPDYFRGALNGWKADNSTMYKTATKKTIQLTEENRKKLRSMMDDEYEVYYYALGKFERLKRHYNITP